MWSRAELARDFRALGVTEGDVVMLHASVRSVGEARIVDAYLESTGNHGARVGNAVARLISARDLYSFAGPLIQKRASSRDP